MQMKQLLFCLPMRLLCAATAMLIAGAGNGRAAGTAESRLYQSGSKKLQDGFWSLAEKDFTEFAKTFPDSELYADVAVKKAQAQFKQRKFDEMLAWLDSQQARAGKSADEFAYWRAEANFYKGSYAASADMFDQLVKDFPESGRRLDSIVESADARAKLGDWPKVAESLGKAGNPFQQIARTNQADTNVVRGIFLLSRAQSEQKDYAAAEKSLEALSNRGLKPEWEWGRQYLLCDLFIAQGRGERALEASTNLLMAAGGRPDLAAESVATRGEILERMGRLSEAISQYETNLASEFPAVRRDALLRIVELNMRAKDLDAAATRLRGYLAAHPNEKNTDLEWLTLGEIALRQFFQTNAYPVAAVAGTNLADARADFQKVINQTNSSLAGKAELNMGWCFWAEGRLAESGGAFSNAVPGLPPFSEDQAVARFKLGDVFYELKDYPRAIASYKTIISSFDHNAQMKVAARFQAADALYPPRDTPAPALGGQLFIGAPYDAPTAVKDGLFERALYQIVRASLETTNLAEADDALKKILEWYPDRLLAQPSMLLVGQALENSRGPAAARKVFMDFVARFPQSALLPEVKLAVARTYETEHNWPAAIGLYDDWIRTYPANPALPRAEFSRAWANSAADRETNAFDLFTNFVTRFQTNAVAITNDLIPAAKIWVGDYYFRREDFGAAEAKYQEVFEDKNWLNSEYAFRAAMKAGMAAVARANYPEAIKLYFKPVAANTNCPLQLRLQAQFAIADADVAISTATNLAPCADAIEIFNAIADAYPTNSIGPLARGRAGDCYRQMAATNAEQYRFATNAYEQVITNQLADISMRSAAAFGIAATLEDLARLKPASGQEPLLRQALDRYLDIVYFEKNLRDNEQPDLFWIEQAGTAAGRLLESFGDWEQAINLYQRLADKLPFLRQQLEIKASRVREKQTASKN